MPPKKRLEPVQGSRMHRLPPSPERENLRSATPMGFARAVSNRVIFIDDGKIQEDEPPQELFTNPKHPRLKAFLSKML